MLRDECWLIDQSLDASLDTSIWAGEIQHLCRASVDAIAINAAAAKNPTLIAYSLAVFTNQALPSASKKQQIELT